MIKGPLKFTLFFFLLVQAGSGQCPSPTAVSATPAAICPGGSSSLSAIAAGGSINWYTTANGGSPLANSLSSVAVSLTPSISTTYYAESMLISTISFSSIGTQLFYVPAGVTQLSVDCRGAAGGTYSLALGGKGGRTQALIPVTPGQLLDIIVGEGGIVGGFSNPFGVGGGSGGGSGAGSVGCSGGGGSEIRVSPYTVSSRIVAAGGGGGGCWNGFSVNGGDGGGLTGANGSVIYGNACSNPTAPTGGTQYSGGTGGSTCGWNGSNGSLGPGGNSFGSFLSAGGGGGYFGGGGGSNAMSGAGGSSFTYSLASSVVHTQGYQAGDGLIIITYTCTSATRSAVTVTVNPTPTVTASSGSVCSGNTFAIVASGANTYTITGGSFTVNPAITNIYSVTGTSTDGCISGTALSTISVQAIPMLTVNSATICSGRSAVITPTGAANYTITGGSYTVNPVTTATYSLTGMGANGCTNTAVSTVSVNTTPTISANSFTTVCAGSSVAITPTGAVNYSITGSTFTVSPSVTTSYTVMGIAANGCTNTAVATVSVNSTPTLAVNSATICSGTSVMLTPTGAASYSITGNTFSISPTVTTSYSVTGTGTNGCVSSVAVANVTVYGHPVITINSGSICAGNSFTFYPNGATTYSYSNGNVVVSPGITSTYSVTGTSAYGCSSSNTAVATVTVVHNSFLIASGINTICAGESTTLIGIDASTYSWSTGAATNSIALNPSVTTVYTLSGTQGACRDTILVPLFVNPLPTVTVNSGTVCEGSSFIMMPSGAATYSYSNGFATVSPGSNSSYTVTGTSTAGCNSAPVVCSITVIALPQPSITADVNTICAGETATLVASGADSYLWNDGSTAANYTVMPLSAKVYTLTATTNGCINTTAFALNVSDCTRLQQYSTSSGLVAVYPNPTNGQVIITSGLSEKLMLCVHNMLGDKVLEVPLANQNEQRLDLGQLANGVYMVFILKNNSILHTMKLIKE